MKLCERIKILIEQSGEPLTKIAYELGISQASLSRIINCKQEPGIQVVIKIAKYFKIPLNELLGIEENYIVNENHTIYFHGYGIYDDIIRKLNSLLPKHRNYILQLIDIFYEIIEEDKK